MAYWSPSSKATAGDVFGTEMDMHRCPGARAPPILRWESLERGRKAVNRRWCWRGSRTHCPRRIASPRKIADQIQRNALPDMADSAGRSRACRPAHGHSRRRGKGFGVSPTRTIAGKNGAGNDRADGKGKAAVDRQPETSGPLTTHLLPCSRPVVEMVFSRAIPRRCVRPRGTAVHRQSSYPPAMHAFQQSRLP